MTLGAFFSAFGGAARDSDRIAGGGSIFGSWELSRQQTEIAIEFRVDGTFHQVNRTAFGVQEFGGRFAVSGPILQIQPEGHPVVQQIGVRFVDADTILLTYASGETAQARRVGASRGAAAAAPAASSAEPKPRRSSSVQPPPGEAEAKPARLFMRRTVEPNEQAFSILVPDGWKTAGGIFNVNPLQTNGPGNTLSPKCDFAVKSDEAGTVLIHWLPSWNYADLSFSPSGFGLFQPGQFYKGMPVRVMVSARDFLLEALRREHPQATAPAIVAEDPLTEVAQAFQQRAQAVNASLRQMGIRPMQFESLALVVEYDEGGRRFRETAMTTIADNRHGAFQWSNENTVLFRAPAAEFAKWKPVLDLIRTSEQPNPQWLAQVARASGERARLALETQHYINRVGLEIVENRRRTNAEIRHEQWLFISGQEEYRNPFTGEVERGTSEYGHRWVNNRGDILYTDDNSYDPNRTEEYNTREWKRSEVWDRKT